MYVWPILAPTAAIIAAGEGLIALLIYWLEKETKE